MTHSRWIHSAAYDATFYMAPALLVPLIVLWVERQQLFDSSLLFLPFLAVGGSHVALGWTIPYRNLNFVRFNAGRYLAVGLFMIIGSFVMAGWHPELVVNLYLYWGTFHFARQHWGFVSMYRVKAREAKDTFYRFEWLVVHAGMLIPVLIFAGSGRTISFYGLPIYTIALPGTIRWILQTALIAVVAIYGVGIWRRRRERAINTPRVAMTLLALVNYFITFTFIDNVLLMYIAANTPHSIQYIALVVKYHRRIQGRNTGRLLRNTAIYLAGYLVIGGFLAMHAKPEYGLRLLYGVFGITIYHYAMDAWLWKAKHNPELKAALPL